MTIKIYLSEDRKCTQVINPTHHFKGGSVSALVHAIAPGNYGYEVL